MGGEAIPARDSGHAQRGRNPEDRSDRREAATADAVAQERGQSCYVAVSRLVKGYNRMVTKRSKMPCRAELFGHPERARDLKLGLLRPPLASGSLTFLLCGG